MKTLNIFCAGRFVSVAYCDEQCDRCNWRYICYTTGQGETLDITPNIYDLERYTITEQLGLRGYRLMQCPHCQAIFKVRFEQLIYNVKFRCPACRKYNYGSSHSEHNVLIGTTDKVRVRIATRE